MSRRDPFRQKKTHGKLPKLGGRTQERYERLSVENERDGYFRNNFVNDLVDPVAGYFHNQRVSFRFHEGNIT